MTTQAPIGVPLTKGHFAIVDAEDADAVLRHSWCFDNGYAWAKINKRKVALHVFLAQPDEGFWVDHISRNGLDNRRENLRVVSPQENAWNKPSLFGSTSRFKGVSWDASRGRWRAGIRINDKLKFLGRYNTEEEAARAYDAAVLEHAPDSAFLNFPREASA